MKNLINSFKLLLLLFVATFFVHNSYSQTTYTVTSTSVGPNATSGTFLWAVDQANMNPGADIIEFTPGLQVNAADANVAGSNPYMAGITESVTVDGNGAALNGIQSWIGQGGIVNSTSACPGNVSGTFQLAFMPGFLKVGTPGADNSAIEVTVKNLYIEQFNSIAEVNENATLIFDNFEAQETWSTWQCVSESAILARTGASLEIYNSIIEDAVMWGISGLSAAIFGGQNAGDLTIEGSILLNNNLDAQPAINWDGASGSEVNIVSSRLVRSGGIISAGASVSNIVNSTWITNKVGVPSLGDRFENASSEAMNITASSFVWNTWQCDALCQGFLAFNNLFEIKGAGNINFSETAVGFNFDFPIVPPATELNTFGVNGGTGVFTADAYTWIQPTTQQDAAALKTITSQPALLTNTPAFNSPVFPLGTLYDLELVAPAVPGELIDVIPSGTPLPINPIDGSDITLDVAGNPRVDANGERDIGALQLGLAPFLGVSSSGDAFVDLNWNEPLHHDGLTIIKYEVVYDVSGGSSPTSVDIGASTLAHTVTGLTNGTEYEFQVRAVYTGSENGPYSNTVKETPYGSIGTPVVDAVGFDGWVYLNWSLPDLGGRDFVQYSIQWRIEGTTNFIGAQAFFDESASTTNVPGLTNGTTYEFSVKVYASGEFSNPGYATATPDVGLGIDDLDLLNGKFSYYPNPVEDYLHINLDETFQAKVFSINGSLLVDVKNEKTIDISNFSSGTYILQIQIEDKIYSSKILKK